LLKAGGWSLALVKPQFEAGRGEVGKGGVVRDRAAHRRVLLEVAEATQAHGLTVSGLMPSPLRGPKGNREFFLNAVKGADAGLPDLEAAVEAVVAS
ncbi:MAG: SAM-dependent methyltransferase, partial [Candidatus Tectimicrobiota bacterium]